MKERKDYEIYPTRTMPSFDLTMSITAMPIFGDDSFTEPPAAEKTEMETEIRTDEEVINTEESHSEGADSVPAEAVSEEPVTEAEETELAITEEESETTEQREEERRDNKVPFDLYLSDGNVTIAGNSLYIESKTNLITQDDVLLLQNEKGEQVSFTPTQSEATGNFYFDIVVDTPGVWHALAYNDLRIKDEELNFTVYRSAEEYLSMAEERWKHVLNNVNTTRAVSLSRLSGRNRYETAANVSKSIFASANNVIVTTGDSFKDSLVSINFANLVQATILYTTPNELKDFTRAEIARIRAKRVFVVGGPVAINESVVAEIRAIPTVQSVKRISGSNSSETAIALAQAAKEFHTANTCILTSGSSYEEAIAAGGLSGGKNYPILYVSAGVLRNETKDYIARNFSSVIIVGGTGAVPNAVESTLRGMGKTVTRVAGADNYEISRKIAASYFPHATTTYVAAGNSFVDAVVGSVAAAWKNAPMVLVKGDTVHTDFNRYLAETKITRGNIIGGPVAVTERYEAALKKALTNAQIRKDLVIGAQQQIGKPYALGAEGPKAFDCSGLTLFLYRNYAGKELLRRAVEQSTMGRAVSRAKLLPGDLIFFAYNENLPGVVSHVGIYVGDNRMIHAPDVDRFVEYANIYSGSLNTNYVTSRNLLD
ncbi:MAG: cell wall-binding repeat-containing protein [Bacillota bacterium]|nr:cell wall-binding repeat-containing protein [Bacillota bacterium]